MNFIVIILLILPCELYEIGITIILSYSEENDSTNGILGTESAAWHREKKITIYNPGYNYFKCLKLSNQFSNTRRI